ncbi:hypothetical protein PENTCL1PPCAC_13029, partial [Pristionchus entomophagus]
MESESIGVLHVGVSQSLFQHSNSSLVLSQDGLHSLEITDQLLHISRSSLHGRAHAHAGGHGGSGGGGGSRKRVTIVIGSDARLIPADPLELGSGSLLARTHRSVHAVAIVSGPKFNLIPDQHGVGSFGRWLANRGTSGGGGRGRTRRGLRLLRRLLLLLWLLTGVDDDAHVVVADHSPSGRGLLLLLLRGSGRGRVGGRRLLLVGGGRGRGLDLGRELREDVGLLDGLDLGLAAGRGRLRIYGHVVGRRVASIGELLGAEGWDQRASVRIETDLPQIGLARHEELQDVDDALRSELVHSIDFVLHRGHAALAHPADGALRFARGVRVDVVHVGRIVIQLVVANGAVALRLQIEQAGVLVVQREEHAVGGVQLLLDHRVVQVVGISQGVESLGSLGESSGDDSSSTIEDGPLRLETLVAHSLLQDLSRVRVEDANLLVLAGGHEAGAVPVEGDRPDHIGMAVDLEDDLARAHVPHQDLVLASGSQQDIGCSRMPCESVDALLVPAQLDHRLGDVLAQAALGDQPHLGGRVLRAGGDDVVVEGRPGDLEARRLVSIHEGIVLVDSADLQDGDDHEGSSGASVDQGDKLGIDVAEERVPRDLGDLEIGHAVLVLDRLAEDMPELGLTHDLSHGCRGRWDAPAGMSFRFLLSLLFAHSPAGQIDCADRRESKAETTVKRVK